MHAEIVDRLAARLTPICAEAVRQMQLRGILEVAFGAVLLLTGLILAWETIRASRNIPDFWAETPGRWVLELMGGISGSFFGILLICMGVAHWLTPLPTLLAR